MRLTLPQQDVYFEQLLFPNDPIYNIGAKIEIKGPISIKIIKEAYVELINQHDAYRSIIVKNEENVSVKISDQHKSELGFIDFSHFQKPEDEADLYMQNEFLKPFDLSKEKLLHIFTLVKVSENYYYLFSVYHHIITDGWGTSLMFQRLVQNYNEILEFGTIKSNYPYSYKDFVEEDFQYQNSESFIEDLEFWTQKFKSLPEILFENNNKNVQINKSKRKELFIKRDIYNQLNAAASGYKCSTFHLILGVLYTYFGSKQRNYDFAVGLPVLNRGKAAYKKTVGLFMGISPLRMQLDFEATFQELIFGIKNQLKQDYRHQRLPLGKLIQELQLYGEKERLFNITLSYEKQDYSTHFNNTQTKVIPLSHQSERVAVAVYVREFDELEDVKIDFDYNLNYFNDESIDQVARHFKKLIDEVLMNPNCKLKELDYLDHEERQQILFDFNDTKADYPKDKTFIDLFQKQCKLSAEKIAIKDDLKSYTYYELDKLSNQIADYIISKFGQKDKSPIAVLLDRSVDMIAVLLGILKSGRSYIPLDPAFPKERLSYIVDNSQSKILIGENDYNLGGIEELAILSLENILENIEELEENRSVTIFPKDTAYIIYTSGSTGNPKGVEIGHQSLLNFLTSIQQKPGISSSDILFSVTTYSFDISILEFFAPLLSGATLYIANQEILNDPNFIIRKIEEIKPTLIQATPSFYQMLFNADWYGDKELKVLCGGDLLSEGLAEKLISNCLEVWNMYGPTETTIWSCIKKIEHPKEASNLGKPINNTRFYILDSFLSPKPIGTPGGIYIAGDGLAKGYYKNELLTNEKFIRNPFDPAGLLYETGDVGKWNNKGEIEFLGRNDNQVKIRGYRIELGDIESKLNKIFGVKESVVIAKKGNQQETFLVAYILKGEEEIDIEEIGAELKMNLPYYMIPNVIIPLEEFPLTPNRKIDRKNLTQRTIQQNSSGNDFKVPNSDLEKKLSGYWAKVLNKNEPLSLNDDFFALGGHSLNAVKLAGLVAKDLSFDITLKTIFDYPTIGLLADYLQKLIPSQSIMIASAECKDFYNLMPSQYNIWLASQQKNSSIAYNMFAAYTVDGVIDLDKITKAINTILKKYEILRTNFIEINGIPYQKINSYENVRFTISIDELKKGDFENSINQFIGSEFDLENDLLIRVQLFQIDKNKFVLVFCTHHIIMDGISLEIFIREFTENYNSPESSKATGEDVLKLQFKDYSEWFNKAVRNNDFKNELFWKKYLKQYEPKDTFDRDFEVEQNQQRASKHLFELTMDITSDLKKLALSEKVTFYSILVAALNVFIYKFSSHSDICIGTVNSGRNIPELNNQIGMFVKTLILRTQIESEQTFVDILKSTQNNLLVINDYQDVPFDKLPQPVFDILLAYQNPEFSFENIDELNDFKLNSYPIDNMYSRMPIVFNLFESDNRLKGIIEYNSDLFEKNTIQTIALKYNEILKNIIKDPLMKVDLIDDKLAFEMNSALDFDFNF